MKQIAKCAFKNCTLLQRVIFQKDSCLEKIGTSCFENSGLCDISLPKRIKDVSRDAFLGCDKLENVFMEEGSQICLAEVEFPSATQVTPAANVLIGNDKLADLRRLRDVSFPEGTVRIGNYWFFGSGVENVTVPASVKTIGVDAFCNCKNLKSVTFADGSTVEQIESGCFYGSKLAEIELPATLKKIGWNTFAACGELRAVWVEDGCKASIGKFLDVSVAVLPSNQFKVGSSFLWELRS